MGTKDCLEVEKRIESGDEYAKLVYEAMALQVAKSVAGLSCVLKGQGRCDHPDRRHCPLQDAD